MFFYTNIFKVSLCKYNMSNKKKLITIELEHIKAKAELVYKADIVKSGNGSCIRAPREFLGKKAIVIVLDE